MIQAMEERGGARVVRALVPLSEMFGYVGDLRSQDPGPGELHDAVRLLRRGSRRNVAKEIIAKATGE